jgi:hypothetical protein
LEKKIHEKRSRHKVTEMVPLEKKLEKEKIKLAGGKNQKKTTNRKSRKTTSLEKIIRNKIGNHHEKTVRF